MTEDKKEIKRNSLRAEMAGLMSALSANTSDIGDWKIVKCYEASLKGEEAPYDITELSVARQEARDRINAIQKELKKIEK